MSRNNPVEGYLRQIRACNPAVTETFLPWLVQDQVVGWVRPKIAQLLQDYPDVFRVTEREVRLNSSLADFTARTTALQQVAGDLAGRGVITPLLGEPYPVTAGGRDAAVCSIDRAAGAYFGIRAFGQHLNGYVRRHDQMYMWLGRRAQDRLVFPGHLDNLVAGGLPHGADLMENLVKEGWEEAALPPELVRQAIPVGAVTYNRVAERGYRPDVLYCYDLELSAAFTPQNTDGEVEEFLLLPVEDVARLVWKTDEFKLNCNLVVIDFLLRHGYIDPSHPDYLELVIGLRPSLAGPAGP